MPRTSGGTERYMIYLDNAATTFPKPQKVIDAVSEHLRSFGGNPGRGGHSLSERSGEKVFECREFFARLIGAESPEQIIFTKNTTEALNLGIKGVLKPGDEVIISSMEHNSVLRSAVSLEKKGITLKIARADSKGFVSEESVLSLIGKRTKLICIIHASNVVGTVNPVESICKKARALGVLTLIDCAQTGGILDIKADFSDMIAFAGHKGLYGPFGTGALYIRRGLFPDTLIEGGTGSLSESALMPDILPDRYEAGTLNAAGISGLCEGIKFVMSEGVREKEAEISKFLREELSAVKGARLLGNPEVGVAGLLLPHHDCVEVASRLDSEYSVAVRAGLHCAPMAHRTLGTVTKGLLRVSSGFFTTKDDIRSAAYAIEKILN